MGVETIIAIVAIILLINYVIIYIFKTKYLTTYTDADKTIHITSETLNKDAENSNPVNYTTSIWIYVNDWTYRYGEEKIVVARGFPVNNTILIPCPSISLGSIENQLIIRSAYYLPDGPPVASASAGASVIETGYGHTNADETALLTTLGTSIADLGFTENIISSVPLQRWVNIIVSVYGRSMDVYMDGKMVNTFVMPGVSAVNQLAGMVVTPFGGFSGHTTRLQYLSNSVNPEQAWNIYSEGHGSTPDLMSTQVKVSFTQNGATKSLVTF